MGKTVAIVQSSYVPWKGYFDLINLADEFVFFDDRQYTRRDWRNRNKIKTPEGTRWLTIPVQSKGRYEQRIDETFVDGDEWRRRHWAALERSYARAPHFDTYATVFRPLYAERDERRLSRINRTFVEAVCALLGIETTLSWSTDYAPTGDRSERLLSLCEQMGASAYLSGPSARAYLDEQLFRSHGVDVLWMDYSDYPPYPQLHPPFDHHVTVLDLLFHTGPDAPRHMKSFR